AGPGAGSRQPSRVPRAQVVVPQDGGVAERPIATVLKGVSTISRLLQNASKRRKNQGFRNSRRSLIVPKRAGMGPSGSTYYRSLPPSPVKVKEDPSPGLAGARLWRPGDPYSSACKRGAPGLDWRGTWAAVRPVIQPPIPPRAAQGRACNRRKPLAVYSPP